MLALRYPGGVPGRHHSAGGDRSRASRVRPQSSRWRDGARRSRRADRQDRAQARAQGRRGAAGRGGRGAGRGRSRCRGRGSRRRGSRDRGMIPAASRGGFELPTSGPVHDFGFIAAGLVVFLAFIVASRLLARFAGDQLRKRQVRGAMSVLGRRAVTAAVIVLGLFAALGFAVQSANVTLFGLLLATVVAALGVQELLQDYVSGYYVLLERHIRVGDHVSIDTHTGVITEVRLRVTMLKSDEGHLIVIPNSELFTKAVTIFSAPVETRTTPPK